MIPQISLVSAVISFLLGSEKAMIPVVVRIVGIVEFVCRVVDDGVVALYRYGRYRERFLGAITIEKAVSGARSDDLRTSRSECDVGKAPKFDLLVDRVIGGNF